MIREQISSRTNIKDSQIFLNCSSFLLFSFQRTNKNSTMDMGKTRLALSFSLTSTQKSFSRTQQFLFNKNPPGGGNSETSLHSQGIGGVFTKDFLPAYSTLLGEGKGRVRGLSPSSWLHRSEIKFSLKRKYSQLSFFLTHVEV